MNIKECLLLVLIPLGILPVCLCLIVFSLFPQHQLFVPVLISIVIIIVSAIVAIGISTFFQDIFQEISQAIHRLGRDELETEININSTLRDANRLGSEMEQMRHKLLKHRELEIKENTLEVREEMASRMAHDIRSPLSSLQASVRLLNEHVAMNSHAVEIMNLLKLSSQRLENISNDLLSRYHGKTSSGPVLFSIHELLDELLGELQPSPIGQGVAIQKHYNSTALYVYGDKNGILRAIGNVIKNALEAVQKNPDEKIKELAVSTTEGGVNSVESIILKIADSGPGIPSDKIPLILQGGHTEGKMDGHGIGTKVVHDVVEAHQGTLAIESKVGQGTLFTISFPKHNPIMAGSSQMKVTIPNAGVGPIRVVDDEASLREQWRITLKGLGVAVETYTSWEDVVEALPSETLSTFIVDYHFDNSEVDGLEVIRRLKERGYSNLILATAEYWKPAIKEAAKELNITLCPKPLPTVVLSSDVIANPEGVKQSSELNEIATSPQAAPRNDSAGHSVLLIDDDLGIQTTWSVMQKTLGIGKLSMYRSLEEMIAAAANPAEYDLCVIDKNIEQSEYNGAKMLAYLKQNGARTVILATGDSRESVAHDPEFLGLDGVLTSKVPMTLEGLLSPKEMI